ncbi:MCE family protein [Actinomadura montaniterrae]|uniref:MCE family protein n=1 Tax=Actinomadura montaniterrae TaxID=1803903 RepID=A0A6L3VIJ6_9ACTN|nr:MCE family protein [Actinomadura montaniterrae]KAB2362934.1 MCE family protein [Actinomadura montaniterrae]
MGDEHLSGRSRLLYAVAGFAALAVAAAAMVLSASPSPGRVHRFTAVFSAAGEGLDPGRSDVKVRGIAVGRVETVRLRRDGRVAVGFRVEAGVAVPATTRAAIEPVSVFGPKDLTLDLGTGPALRDGARIARTSDPAELSGITDRAYDLTAAIDPSDVATIMRTLSSGLGGEGPALHRTIVHGAALTDAIDARAPRIRRLIGDIAGLSGTLADRGGAITGTAGDLDRLAPAVYQRPDKVSQLLDAAGALSDRVGGTLRDHGASVGRLIDGTANVVQVVAAQDRNLPVLMDVLDRLFRGLGGLIRVPGPDGTLLGRGVDTFNLDLCRTFIDLCQAP